MSTTNSIAITFDNTPGILSVTADNSCGSSPAATLNINVGTPPTAGFTYVLNGGALTLTNTSQNASSFAWSFGDGGTANQAQPSYTYTAPGAYTITLIASNACGDSDTTTQQIQVLGLQDLSNAGIVVYPNPSTGQFTIDGLDAFIGETLSVIDLAGRKVASCPIKSNLENISLGNIVDGLYLIKIQNGVLPLRVQR